MDVFLSYKREEKAVAQDLAEYLSEAGFEVWWDAALLAGADFATIVHEQLSTARAVVIMWSKEARQSSWVRAEADLALKYGTLINTIVDDMAFEGIPPEYSHIQAVRLDGDPVAFHAAVRRAIEAMGTAPAHDVRSPADARSALREKVREAEFYSAIASSTDSRDFEDYLKQFGLDGQFAPMARRRLEALRTTEIEQKRVLPKLWVWATGGLALVASLFGILSFFGMGGASPPGSSANPADGPTFTMGWSYPDDSSRTS